MAAVAWEGAVVPVAAEQGADKMSERVSHEFSPVFDRETAKVLILGTMPSPASRQEGFYYGHPRNRFWKVISSLLGTRAPSAPEEKRRLLLENGIALWDVLKSCHIIGASDTSIRCAEPNDIGGLISGSGIRAIFFNGRKAMQLFDKLCNDVDPDGELEKICLPSTSPANAAFSLERLKEEYCAILRYLS